MSHGGGGEIDDVAVRDNTNERVASGLPSHLDLSYHKHPGDVESSAGGRRHRAVLRSLLLHVFVSGNPGPGLLLSRVLFGFSHAP